MIRAVACTKHLCGLPSDLCPALRRVRAIGPQPVVYWYGMPRTVAMVMHNDLPIQRVNVSSRYRHSIVMHRMATLMIRHSNVASIGDKDTMSIVMRGAAGNQIAERPRITSLPTRVDRQGTLAMIVIVDDAGKLGPSCAQALSAEGVSATCLPPSLMAALGTPAGATWDAVEAMVLVASGHWQGWARPLRQHTRAPIVALRGGRALAATLDLYDAGVDDVVDAPVHPRELLARFAAIRRRGPVLAIVDAGDPIRVFADGRDPIVAGQPLPMPRRERRILESLAGSRTAWQTKTQVFDRVYGFGSVLP